MGYYTDYELSQGSFYFEERRTTYLARLMALMNRAQAANFELTVTGMMFVLRDRDDRDAEKFYLDVEYGEDSLTLLEQFTWEVAHKEETERESNHKFLAKQTALAKLTQEERKLLNVSL